MLQRLSPRMAELPNRLGKSEAAGQHAVSARPPSSAKASSALTRAADALLRYSPAQPVFRWRASRQLVALAYHDVRDPDLFAEQMRILRRIARPISADDACAALGNRRHFAHRAVLVTFDDGDRSVLDAALPVLSHFGIPAVAFLVSSVLDTETPLWWQEVEMLVATSNSNSPIRIDTNAEIRRLKRLPNAARVAAIALLRQRLDVLPRRPQLRRGELATLERAGIEIGNHSLTHPCLDQCDDQTVDREIADAHRHFIEALGHAPRLFAYPNGNFDARAVRVLDRLGYQAAFLFDHRISRSPPRDRFAISRVRVSSTTSIDRFRTIVSGLRPAIHHARGLA